MKDKQDFISILLVVILSVLVGWMSVYSYGKMFVNKPVPIGVKKISAVKQQDSADSGYIADPSLLLRCRVHGENKPALCAKHPNDCIFGE